MQNIIAKWVREWSVMTPSRKLLTVLLTLSICVCFALVFLYKNNDESKEQRRQYLEGRNKECEERYERLQAKYDDLEFDYRAYLKNDKNFKSRLMDTLKTK